MLSITDQQELKIDVAVEPLDQVIGPNPIRSDCFSPVSKVCCLGLVRAGCLVVFQRRVGRFNNTPIYMIFHHANFILSLSSLFTANNELLFCKKFCLSPVSNLVIMKLLSHMSVF